MKVRETATKHLKKVETSKKPKYPWADSSEKEKKEAKERKREQRKGDDVETSHDQFTEERYLWREKEDCGQAAISWRASGNLGLR